MTPRRGTLQHRPARTLVLSVEYTSSMARVAAYRPASGYTTMWKPMALSSVPRSMWQAAVCYTPGRSAFACVRLGRRAPFARPSGSMPFVEASGTGG